MPFDPAPADSVSPARRDEVRAWLGLGLGALAVAGVFALMLAISRVPGSEKVFPWPVHFFEKGLVIHVVFSFVVWFLTVFAALVASVTPEPAGGAPIRRGPRPALTAAAVSLVLLGLPAVLDRGEPSLNNYVPAIIDPAYYAGLAALAAAILAVSIRFWMRYDRERTVEPRYRAAVGGTLIYFGAMACFVLGWLLNIQQPLSVRFNEDVFWGGGHALQFLNTLLMVAGWWILAGSSTAGDRAYRWAIGLAAAPALAMPLLFVLYPTDSGRLFSAFTNAQYLLALPAGAALVALWQGNGRQTAGLPGLALRLSIATFLIGGFLGLFVDGADTRTPAHYHAVIAAVNLSLIGVIYVHLIPFTGRGAIDGRWPRLSLWGYGLGQMIHSVGLFLAGGYGAPRKTAGDAQGIVDLGAQAGLYMMGVGALIAVIGGVAFVWIASRTLLKSPDSEKLS